MLYASISPHPQDPGFYTAVYSAGASQWTDELAFLMLPRWSVSSGIHTSLVETQLWFSWSSAREGLKTCSPYCSKSLSVVQLTEPVPTETHESHQPLGKVITRLSNTMSNENSGRDKNQLGASWEQRGSAPLLAGPLLAALPPPSTCLCPCCLSQDSEPLGTGPAYYSCTASAVRKAWGVTDSTGAQWRKDELKQRPRTQLYHCERNDYMC